MVTTFYKISSEREKNDSEKLVTGDWLKFEV